MIPIQTVLALLAFLMMVGCSQKPPPGSPPKENRNAIATNNNGNGNPSNVKPGEPTASTSPTPVPTLELVTSDDQKSITLKFTGEEAQHLYEATGVKAERGVKKGFSYQCTEENKAYECAIIIQGADGVVNILQDLKDVKQEKASLVPAADLIDSAITFVAHDPKNPMNSFARIVLIGSNASPIFQAMTSVQAKPVAAGERDGGKYSAGLVKNGVNVSCEERPWASDATKKDYWCNLYLTLTTGTVDLIQQN